jgi:transcriptional regulator with XRE-family HTH domain
MNHITLSTSVPSYTTFGEGMKHYRLQNGWSRPQVAKMMGIHEGSYGRMEHGTDRYARPSRETVLRYAEVLKAPQNEFLALAGFLPDEEFNDTLLSGVAHVRLFKIAQASPRSLKMVEDYISLIHQSLVESGKIEA